MKPTIPLNEVIDDLASTTDATSGLKTSGGATLKGEAISKTEIDSNFTQSVNTSPFLQIDGDFNNANRDSLPYFDVWTYDWSGAIGTISVKSHYNDDGEIYSKDNYLNITTTVADTATRIMQRPKGNPYSGKDISVFWRAKYTTNKPTSIQFRVRDDSGSTKGQGIFPEDLTTSWAWYRLDVSVGEYLADWSEIWFNNQNDEIFDLDIDKIRIVESSQIPTGTIPEWIKADEPKQSMARDVREYLQVKVGYSSGSARVPIITGFAKDANTLICQVSAVKMVQDPVITIDFFNYSDIASGTQISQGSPIISDETTRDGFLTFIITDTGKFTANKCYFVKLASDNELIADATY